MVVSDGHKILLAAHIDDFIVSCERPPAHSRQIQLCPVVVLTVARFDSTSEGVIRTYLDCEIQRNILDGHNCALSETLFRFLGRPSSFTVQL
jgi:hypothetical protein